MVGKEVQVYALVQKMNNFSFINSLISLLINR